MPYPQILDLALKLEKEAFVSEEGGKKSFITLAAGGAPVWPFHGRRLRHEQFQQIKV